MELTWQEFLRFKHWDDGHVYGRQGADTVFREWTIYTFRMANGDLPSGGGIF